MDSQVFATAKEAAERLVEPIDSASLPLDLARATAAKGTSFTPLPDLSFAVEAGAEVAISAFNAANDTDELAIFGASQSADAPTGTAWRPMLQASPDLVWLRYLATCHLKLGAAASAGLAKFKVDSGAALAVATYMPHRKSAGQFASVAKAVADDLSRLPHVFDHQHLRKLTADQVLAIELGGNLSLSIELDWADVLTGLTDPVHGLALDRVALAPKIDASAKLRFALGVSGLFRVAFRGLPDGWVELQLLSNRRRQLSLGMEAGLNIAFSDPDAAQAVLPELAGELLGGDPQTLANWKASITDLQTQLKAAYDSLLGKLTAPGKALERYLSQLQLDSRLQRLQHIQQRVSDALEGAPGIDQAAQALSETLGLSVSEAAKLISGVQALPGKLNALATEQAEKLWESTGLTRIEDRLGYALDQLERLESIITRIAKAQVKLRFSYEYSRTEDNAALFSVKLDAQQTPAVMLKKLHQAALSLDATEILGLANDHPRLMTDGLLLGHSISERRRALGFTLGVARWSAALNWERTRKRVTLSRQVQGGELQVRHSLLGQRSFDAKGFATQSIHAGEMLLGMPEYRPENGPDGDWTAALDLRRTRTYPKLDQRDLADTLDHAELWGVITDQQLPELQQRLLPELRGKRIRARIELSLDAATIADARIKTLLRGDLDPYWVQALAGALAPAGQPERTHVRDRERLYASVTPVLVEQRYIGLSVLPLQVLSRIHRGLRDAGASRELVNWEKAERASTTLGTMQYHARFAKGFLRTWPRMAHALRQLATADDWSVAGGLETGLDLIDILDQAWTDNYSQRAFGRLMVLMHREAGLAGGMGAKLCLERVTKTGEVGESWLVVG